MSYVQIIYKDKIPNELLEEGTDLSPIFVDSAEVNEEAEEEVIEELDETTATLPVSEDIQNQNQNTSQENSRILGVEWGNRDTNYMLKKYNKYIVMTGSKKRFRTKRDMWCRISQDIKKDLKLDRSAYQCENRYKTVLRKWRKRKYKDIDQEEITEPATNASNTATSSAPNISNRSNVTMTTSSNASKNEKNYDNEPKNQKKYGKGLAEVLWDIFKKKEEGRERRHKEKMELIKKLMTMDQFSS